MSTRAKLCLSAVLVSGALFTFGSTTGHAGVPTIINFQGILLDSVGFTVADSTYSLIFRIWDAAAGGNLVWDETQIVTTENGLFSTALGAIDPILGSFFDSPDRWLEMELSGSGTPYVPRTKMGSVAYAYRVGTVDGATGGAIQGKLAVGPGHTYAGDNVFVAGLSNNATGQYSSVCGGSNNSSTGLESVVGGGFNNLASGLQTMVGGGFNNDATGDKATVSGGGDNQAGPAIEATVGGGAFNTASGAASTVAGGNHNMASGDVATIGGGSFDTASGGWSVVGGGIFNSAGANTATVGGGAGNAAIGISATVPGGKNNLAQGNYSYAAGMQAKARAAGAVVISANNSEAPTDTINTNNAEQMVFRADGGIYITNTSGNAPANGGTLINTVTGAYLTTGGQWTNASDRNLKENFAPVDGSLLLSRIDALPISEWNYKVEDDAVRHIGPTAQDFHALFGVGNDDKSISTIDPAGIALAAIQELHRHALSESAQKDQQIAELREQVVELRRLVGILTAKADGPGEAR